MTALSHEIRFDPRLLDYLDENGYRYEVIDGAIVMNPPPGFRHELVAARLLIALGSAAPPDLVVLGSHLGFFYDGLSFVMADLTIGHRADFSEDGLHVAPLLVVEVLGPSSRWTDLRRKREIYEQVGVASYWVVDPKAETLSVLELQDGAYVEAVLFSGKGEFALDRPFPVSIVAFAD